jgi:hypothetical protein
LIDISSYITGGETNFKLNRKRGIDLTGVTKRPSQVFNSPTNKELYVEAAVVVPVTYRSLVSFAVVVVVASRPL